MRRSTYTAGISACEKGQQPQQALHLLQEMQLRGLLPDVITYSAAVYALRFAGLLDMAFYKENKKVVLEVGRVLDRRWPPRVEMGDGRLAVGSKRFCVPHIELDLPDRLLVHKPPGWEVDTTNLGNAKPKRLSHFVQSVLAWPLARDALHKYGFLHRLDMPSSGLILVAKTYEAHYDLQLQLNGGVLIRDYIVLCHGLMPPNCMEINARVYVRHEVNLLSAVFSKGKPSATRVNELAQCHRAGLSSGEGEDFSLLATCIRTGRRHQIRTHMLHAGHPVACDGKYTTSVAFERAWCERNFLHRYRSAFADTVGRTHEVLAPLPSDLLVPKFTWLGQKKQQLF